MTDDEEPEEWLSDHEKFNMGLISIPLIPSLTSAIILILNEWNIVTFSQSIITDADSILAHFFPIVIIMMLLIMVADMATGG